MAKNDGGPAFPLERHDYKDSLGYYTSEPGSEGMSLRDWFAGQALQSLAKVDSDNGRFRDEATAERTASFAYQLADAMIAEREKGK